MRVSLPANDDGFRLGRGSGGSGSRAVRGGGGSRLGFVGLAVCVGWGVLVLVKGVGGV